jgi:hypothetical protein
MSRSTSDNFWGEEKGMSILYTTAWKEKGEMD